MDSHLKPCPYCGENTLVPRYDGGRCFVICLSCEMRGPAESKMNDAKYAWNAIPRTPEWTSEPPTQTGWYFTRRNRPGKPLRVMYVKEEKRYDHRVKEERKVMTMAETRSETGYIIEELNQDDRQWAGPIPDPKDAR